MNQRKALYILIAGIILIALFFGGYFWLSSKQAADGGQGQIIDYLPFGTSQRGNTPANTPVTRDPVTQLPVVELPIPQLRQLTTYPVSGIQAVAEKIPKTETETEKNIPTALYIAKSTGFMFKQSLVASGEKKVSALAIPNTHETLFNPQASAVLFRYLRPNSTIIETYIGKISSFDELTQATNITGSFLPQDISSTTFLSNGTKFLYGIPGNNGSVWTTSALDGSGKKQVLISAFKEWIVEWPIEGKIFFTTKASGGIPGYTYTLTTASGNFEKVIGNIPGLTTKINQNGTMLAFSRSMEVGMTFNILNIPKQTVIETGLQTLPEKCIWAKDMITLYCAVPNNPASLQYPDSWYQGLTDFSDSIWKIDSGTGITKLVINILSTEGKEIDAINLTLDPEENYLLFINKRDGTAWSYALNK
jgi:hypothetical protein